MENNTKEVKELIIPTKLLQDVLNYLAEQKFKETHILIYAIQKSAKPVKEEMEVAKPVMKEMEVARGPEEKSKK